MSLDEGEGAGVAPPFLRTAGRGRAGSRGPRGFALSGPTRPGCPCSLRSLRAIAVCGPVAGALRAVSPRPFSPGPCASRPGPLRRPGSGRSGLGWPPVARVPAAPRRRPAGRPPGRVWGCAPSRLRRVFGSGSPALPCGALRASCGRPWPSPGAAVAPLAAAGSPRRAPAGWAWRPALAPPPAGAVPAWRRALAPRPGGVGGPHTQFSRKGA